MPWVAFIEAKPNPKTKVWDAVVFRNKEDKNEGYDELGKISWYGAWRRYVFFPAEGCLFDTACLREIAEFCEKQTNLFVVSQSLPNRARTLPITTSPH